MPSSRIFKKKLYTAILMEEEMYRVAFRAAKARGLTFSALVRALLYQYLKQIGEKVPENPADWATQPAPP